MTNDNIHDIARDVSGLIQEAENAADNAVIAFANLLAGAVRARRAAGVRGATGQPTVLRLKRALGRVIDGGTDMLRIHGELHGHYSERASGDTHPYTDEGPQGARTRIRVVEDRNAA